MAYTFVLELLTSTYKLQTISMRTHNLAFIDLETTGLDPEVHEIIEIGCVLIKQTSDENNKPSLEIIDEFEYKIKPIHIETADPVALAVNHYDEKNWTNAIDLHTALQNLSDKTADATMVAHNVAHDYAFLRKAFSQTGIVNKMHYHKLDTISIAFAKLYKNDEIKKFSLRALCEALGIENKNAHTALSDARATFDIFRTLMEL